MLNLEEGGDYMLAKQGKNLKKQTTGLNMRIRKLTLDEIEEKEKSAEQDAALLFKTVDQSNI